MTEKVLNIVFHSGVHYFLIKKKEYNGNIEKWLEMLLFISIEQ